MRLGIGLLATLGALVIFVFGSPIWIRQRLPEFTLQQVEPVQGGDVRALPFFGVMVSLPELRGSTFLPKLEYRSGPPKRFLSRLTLLVITEEREPRDEIVFYGRRTLTTLRSRLARWFYPGAAESYGAHLAAALHWAHSGSLPAHYSERIPFLGRILLALEAKEFIGQATADIFWMPQSQASDLAIMIKPRYEKSLGGNSRLLYLRREQIHEIKISATAAQAQIDPLTLFRSSFLIERRQDAMGLLARELSLIKLGQNRLEKLSFKEFETPLLLLSAKLSIDPASIHAYFHFAGLNALLFREFSQATRNLEVTDSIRNNVLVAERYGHDVAPESSQSAEMGRLARAIVAKN